MLISAATAATLILFGLSSPQSATAATAWASGDPTFTPPAQKPSMVGINYHGMWSTISAADRVKLLDKYQAAGVTWVRMDVAWDTIQPKSASSYDMANGVAMVDERMNELRARGFKALVMFTHAPVWSTGSSSKSLPPGNAADYGRAMGWAANRWKDVAPAFEMWNEPDSQTFWSSSNPTGDYAKLLKGAYPVAKAASPSTTFVTGGPQYVNTDWYTKLYAAGAKGYYDAIAFHPYMGIANQPPGTADTQGMYTMKHIGALVELTARNGEANIPLWATEFGYSTHGPTAGGDPNWRLGVSEATQAQYLIDSYAVMGTFPQVKGAFWYMDRDIASGNVQQINYGLLKYNLSPKPGYYAIKCVASGICKSGSGATAAPPAVVPPAGAALPAGSALVAAGSTWRYSAAGALPASNWNAASYSDSAWSSARSELGFGDGDEAGVIGRGKQSYYFRTSFDAGANVSGVAGLTLKAVVDDGAVVYLNGVELWRYNLPAGAITYSTQASSAIAGATEKAWITVNVPASALKAGTNTLAAEVHNDVPTSSDISFNLSITTR